MRNPYWYFIPNCPLVQPYYQQPQQIPSKKPVESIRELPNCIIEEKYCDYFDLGDKAPDFTLEGIVNCERTNVSLSDYLGKWVVLFFYGSDFTFV